MKYFLMPALAATGLMAASAASAETLKAELDVDSLGTIFISTWEQDSNPTPNSFIAGISTDVPIRDYMSNNGEQANFDIGYSNPSVLALGNDLETGESIETFAGPQIYSGSEAAPVFRVGTFEGFETEIGDNGVPIVLPFSSFALTFTVVPPVVVPVPEPSTWALGLIGFSALGALYRRRRSKRADVNAQAGA
jgi:hypothetical protein